MEQNYSSPPVRPRMGSDKRDLILAAVLLAVSVLFANFSLFGGFRLGYSLGYAAVLLCSGWYLGSRLQKPSLYGWFCLFATVASLGIFVWHADGAMRFFTVVGMTLLSALVLLDSARIGTDRSGTVACIVDSMRLLIGRPMSHLSTAIPAIFLVKNGDTVEKRRFGGALLGVLCALPALLVLVPLLVGADAAFEGLLTHTLLDHFAEVFASAVVGVLLFLVLYSLMFSVRHDLSGSAATSASPRKGISAGGINAFLGTISAVYVLYLFSQLAYFFSAFSGILPEDYTVAQYARRGFFEMCAVCAINLLLVSVCLGLSRKQEGQAPLSTRLISLFVLLFSVGMVATALSKMILYIGSFGMTRRRVLTGVFMVMLGLVLLFVIVRLFSVRFPYMRACVVAVALIGLTVGYVDVDTFIARYNITAYEQERLEELDVHHLTELSEGALPYLVELWTDSRPEDPYYRHLTSHLRYRLDEYGTVTRARDGGGYVFTPDPTPDFRKYNVDCLRARQAIIQQAEAILETEQYYLSTDRYEEDEPYVDDTYNDFSPPDTVHPYRNHLLAEHMGKYYTTQTIERLGDVTLSNEEEASLYHVYYPNYKDDLVLIELDGFQLTPCWVSKPYELGLYLVTDDGVYTLEDAHAFGLVTIHDLYFMLPDEMLYEAPYV